jgi:hypothetical protein
MSKCKSILEYVEARIELDLVEDRKAKVKAIPFEIISEVVGEIGYTLANSSPTRYSFSKHFTTNFSIYLEVTIDSDEYFVFKTRLNHPDLNTGLGTGFRTSTGSCLHIDLDYIGAQLRAVEEDVNTIVRLMSPSQVHKGTEWGSIRLPNDRRILLDMPSDGFHVLSVLRELNDLSQDTLEELLVALDIIDVYTVVLINHSGNYYIVPETGELNVKCFNTGLVKTHIRELLAIRNDDMGITIPSDPGTYAGIFDGHYIYLAPASTEVELSWTEAMDYCVNLDIDGTTGWELPSRAVLLYLYEHMDQLDLVAGNCWSSTEWSATGAWFQNFTNGFQGNDGKTDAGYVRAVRRVAI